MKLFSLLFLLAFSLSFCSQKESHNIPADSTSILWNENYKLKVDDFKGIPPGTSNANAETWGKLDISDGFDFDTETIIIHTRFSKEHSWIKKDIVSHWNKSKTDSLLTHEQGHFNISEVVARMERKFFIDWKPVDQQNEKVEFENSFKATKDSFNLIVISLQQQYDNETNHSANIPKQTEWDLRIDSLLNAYQNYENPEIKIPITAAK